MPDGQSPETGSIIPEPSALVLQIDCPLDGSPLRFPAMVRNLMGGVVTLEVSNPWTSLNWAALKGRGGRLCLRSEDGENTELQGTVTWTGYTGLDQDQLHLGLKLDDPASGQKLVSDHIPHVTADIKSLWDRWDQARQTPERTVSTRTGFAAMSLLLAGVALQLVWPQPYKLFGWLLWLLGTLLVGEQTVHFWRGRKASR
jgi:hypothetical protein